MKKLISIVCVMAMLVSLVACSQSAPTQTADTTVGEKVRVAVAMPTKDLQRWVQDGDNMKAQLEAEGYEVDLQYAANDIQTQVGQIENMIASNPKAIVIASIDGSSLGEPLKMAKEAGIPVIAYDRLLMNSDAVTYYATFDNELVGTKQGEFLEEKLGLKEGNGPFNIEFFTGDPGDNNCVFFFGGAMKVLQPYLDNGQLVCVSGQTDRAVVSTPNWSSENAQSRMENILSSNYPDGTELHAVMCSNDSTAFGVETALEKNYKGEYPLITGQDCDKPNVKQMIAGKQAMSVFKDTRTLAWQVVKMVNSIVKGTEPEINDTTTYNNGVKVVPSYLCEPVVVTLDNYKEMLLDSKYYKESDIQ